MNPDRVWKHYKSLKETYAREGESVNHNSIWLTLARTHKAPVRVIKDIVKSRKNPTMVPVWCCEDHCFVERWVPKS